MSILAVIGIAFGASIISGVVGLLLGGFFASGAHADECQECELRKFRQAQG